MAQDVTLTWRKYTIINKPTLRCCFNVIFKRRRNASLWFKVDKWEGVGKMGVGEQGPISTYIAMLSMVSSPNASWPLTMASLISFRSSITSGTVSRQVPGPLWVVAGTTVGHLTSTRAPRHLADRTIEKDDSFTNLSSILTPHCPCLPTMSC